MDAADPKHLRLTVIAAGHLLPVCQTGGCSSSTHQQPGASPRLSGVGGNKAVFKITVIARVQHETIGVCIARGRRVVYAVNDLTTHIYFPPPGRAVVTGVIPSPRFSSSIFITQRFQQSHCSSIVL